MAKDQKSQNSNIIYSYTREQALCDGVLVDLNEYIPIEESGFKYPVVCTDSIWAMIKTAVDDKNHCNDYKGVIIDILNMARMNPIKRWETGCIFRVIITGVGIKTNYDFKMECSPGDRGEPVLTIMLPAED